MRKLQILLLFFMTFTAVNAQMPCSLPGGSVYIDHTSSPWMMNASVNGMSMYDVLWSNGLVGNQTQFYTNWCVTITDIISGCDTIICENCIPDTMAVCPCPMTYIPVCGCDGNMYANDCIAICAGIYSFTPAIPNGMPGGFLPCPQPVSCGVEIMGDSIVCNSNSPVLLTASPNASTVLPVTYSWSNGQSNSSLLTITSPGTYCVTQIDANGCVDSACITIEVQDIPIYTAPSPPIICLGDSVVLEIDTIGLSNVAWIPNTLITPPVHRIVDFPIFSQTYVVEAIDSAGCDRRGEILVDVDSCVLCIDSSLINPLVICPAVVNPVCGCDGNTYMNDCEALNWYGVTSWTQGPCNPNPLPCGVEITGDSVICSLGSPQILTASPNASTVLPVTYMWSTGQTGPVLTISNPGTYCVTQIDANGCVDSACITIEVQDIPIYTAPSPPIVCLGDSVVLEIDTFGLSNIVWVPNTLLTPPVHRIVDFPIFSQTYVVEATDSAGCDRRGEIFVLVDSCNNGPCAIPFLYVDHDTSTNILEASQFSNNFSYQWSNGDTNHYTSYYPNWCLYVVDLNGCDTTICEVITSFSENDIFNLKIYPNPASYEFSVDLNDLQISNIKLVDAFGKVMFSMDKPHHLITIRTDNFLEGVYFVIIQNHLDIYRYKIIIAR